MKRPLIDIHVTKNKGVQVQLVPEGTPGATIVAVRKIDFLDLYNLSRDQIAKKIGLTRPKTTAMIRYFQIQSDSDCFKEFLVGKTKFQRYSPKAVKRLQDGIKNLSPQEAQEIWRNHGGAFKK